MANIFKNKVVKIIAIVLAVITLILATLSIGTAVKKNYKPWRPNYDMVDISPVLNKSLLSNSDYELLYRQTGLTKLGVDGLLNANKKDEILKIQSYFFAEQQAYYLSFAPFMGFMLREDGLVPHAVLENGDILFSPSTFISMIEMGHSCMVINEDNETLLQASGYGSPSNIITANNIFVRPSFVIVRVNADKSTRNAVTEYAKQNLLGLEYDILAGIFEPKAPKNVERTHCSHIIWYAYNYFGIDVDGSGGKIVTPYDLSISSNVSVVQVFGVDITKYQ